MIPVWKKIRECYWSDSSTYAEKQRGKTLLAANVLSIVSLLMAIIVLIIRYSRA